MAVKSELVLIVLGIEQLLPGYEVYYLTNITSPSISTGPLDSLLVPIYTPGWREAL